MVGPRPLRSLACRVAHNGVGLDAAVLQLDRLALSQCSVVDSLSSSFQIIIEYCITVLFIVIDST